MSAPGSGMGWVLAALLACAALRCLAADAAAAAQRGRALYFEHRTVSAGAPAPCLSCHRRSGLGNFEGGLAVPPIAGRLLFAPLDDDTGHFFGERKRYRVRPAYDTASLGALLRRGVTPDGLELSPAMPRYEIDDAQVADLAEYLRTLADAPPAGVGDEVVRLATVSTPQADPAERDAVLKVLAAYVELKNRQSRHDARRARYAEHSREMLKHTKFRLWSLEHWALEGPKQGWPAQLEARMRERPVFALVSGVGGSDWQAVHDFCEAQAIACVLPLLDAAPALGPDFYSVYFHGGVEVDVGVIVGEFRRRGLTRVALWARQQDGERAGRARAALRGSGLHLVEREQDAQAIVSLLPADEHVRRLGAAAGRRVAWLAGRQQIGPAELAQIGQVGREGWIVSPWMQPLASDGRMLRARSWLRSQHLDDLPLGAASAALQSASALGEGLSHIDFQFTPAYLLEFLEHRLESMPAMGPYPGQSISPGQRIASKGSVLGQFIDGRWTWAWRTVEP